MLTERQRQILNACVILDREFKLDVMSSDEFSNVGFGDENYFSFVYQVVHLMGHIFTLPTRVVPQFLASDQHLNAFMRHWFDGDKLLINEINANAISVWMLDILSIPYEMRTLTEHTFFSADLATQQWLYRNAHHKEHETPHCGRKIRHYLEGQIKLAHKRGLVKRGVLDMIAAFEKRGLTIDPPFAMEDREKRKP
ncbi:hypothetical protein UFOVP75_161 [uncultured Caudovirales phage]|uniref:Uncharacterized protein n=1 Tax=uncultured Caudovirales phage TaxID=2100421 RepID=A0A6J5L2C1_9CAUD|nr:hypothetical protein UFOVP75_161 [uncultured Caudovirales phage]